MPDYQGKFIFIQRLNKDGTVAYDSGEYFCTRESAGVLWCVKPIAGYDGHLLKSFSIVGLGEKWTVIDFVKDDERALELANDLMVFSVVPEHKNWIDSVYSGARNSAQAIYRALGKSEELKENKEKISSLEEISRLQQKVCSQEKKIENFKKNLKEVVKALEILIE